MVDDKEGMAAGAGRGAALHSQQPSKSPRAGSRQGSTSLLTKSPVTLLVLWRKAKKQSRASFSSSASWQREAVAAATDEEQERGEL